MSSIYDFPKVASPYPEKSPWYNLSSLIVNGWEGDGNSTVFYVKVDANEVSYYLRTRNGNSNIVVEGMPAEVCPRAQMVFNAYLSINESGYAALVYPQGRIAIWVTGNDYSRIANGALKNFVLESTFARRLA